MGETTVRRFVQAGAFVTFADVDPTRGHKVEAEINGDGEKCKFVKCDIRVWEDQVALFEAATANERGVHIVIANAGISRSSGDSLWNLDGE
jgi:NAD(P)-dependent dehydrogenase (short-subunit alcohol dehydrogenase family)